mmetsp:Transcript_7733/g.28930  ORF Transcript_7733/g.28930 Transcript_7733/m.28930 type:complete len:222 (+) Transcript_7733:2265-2930(+)
MLASARVRCRDVLVLVLVSFSFWCSESSEVSPFKKSESGGGLTNTNRTSAGNTFLGTTFRTNSTSCNMCLVLSHPQNRFASVTRRIRSTARHSVFRASQSFKIAEISFATQNASGISATRFCNASGDHVVVWVFRLEDDDLLSSGLEPLRGFSEASALATAPSMPPSICVTKPTSASATAGAWPRRASTEKAVAAISRETFFEFSFFGLFFASLSAPPASS